MKFRFFSPALKAVPVISVDGIAPLGPNFSHWPGNRTPRRLKHDLSTGIALGLLDLPEAEQRAQLHHLDLVVNTHIDTDGILSCSCLLAPDQARANRALYLDAARTGDFQVYSSDAALALDLALTDLQGDDHPLAGAWRGATELERHEILYRMAFDELPRLLRDPFAPQKRTGPEFQGIRADLDLVASGAVRVRRHPDIGLAVVESPRPLHRIAVNTAAGADLRVLTVVPYGAGHLYRYHDRVESWFDMVSIRPPPRRPLAPLARRLDDLEASESEPRWMAGDAREPIPECWFGVPGSGPSFGPSVAGDLCVSRMRPRLVERAVVEHFETREVPA